MNFDTPNDFVTVKIDSAFKNLSSFERVLRHCDFLRDLTALCYNPAIIVSGFIDLEPLKEHKPLENVNWKSEGF